jgi:DNA-binding MarR family transcriptional regulator
MAAPKIDFVLQDYVPYLINRAGTKIASEFSREISAFGITLQMWRVLAALWQSGQQSLADLSYRTSIEISTLSRIVGRMEAKKLVKRGRSGDDRRALSLALTKAGERMTQKIIPIANRYERAATRGMTAADIKRMRRLLKLLFANIDVPSGEDAGQGARSK